MSLIHRYRKKLLHEGYGTTILSGFVEICFDNSDRRFPIESDEVLIRRSIGFKKDEFFINSKHATKQDVINFLESAGFSRSNPYYIVQQGKVDKLTNMSEASRLDLLKEVAGTRVYDEKRSESEKIMSETSFVNFFDILSRLISSFRNQTSRS
jgi:structural maintenance of chromosome 3 (chondroitin sulfate proteoglycan 6)